jgi:cardiolipin synthase
VLDEDLAIVGSANLDDRSMKLNFEVAAMFYGGPVNEQMASLFDAFRAKATLKRNLEADAPFGRRLFLAGARLFSPQL